MSSDTESSHSTDSTLVEGSSTDHSDGESEPEPPSRLHTLDYPLLMARARVRLRPMSFNPTSNLLQYCTSPSAEPLLRMFDIVGCVTSRECYMTEAGDRDAEWTEAGDSPVASCWIEAPNDHTDMQFVARLCEVREAALLAGSEVETSQLLYTPPGFHSVLLQVGWKPLGRNFARTVCRSMIRRTGASGL